MAGDFHIKKFLVNLIKAKLHRVLYKSTLHNAGLDILSCSLAYVFTVETLLLSVLPVALWNQFFPNLQP